MPLRNLVYLASIFLVSVKAAPPSDPGMLSEVSLWSFIHPGAKALVGIEWSRVQQSEIGRWVQRRWINSETLPGIEFLPDVEEVLISSPGVASGSSEDPPLLIAVRGRFNLMKVRESLVKHGGRPQMYGNVQIFRKALDKAGEPAFALFNSETILIGDARSVIATLERSRTISDDGDPHSLLARAQLMATQYDCWAVLSEPGAMHNFLFASLAGSALDSESRSFQAGISVKDGLAIDVVFNLRSERAASLLMASLNRRIHLAGLDRERTPDLANLLQQLKISRDQANVMMSLRMDQQQTARGLNPAPQVATASARRVFPGELMPPPSPQRITPRFAFAPGLLPVVGSIPGPPALLPATRKQAFATVWQPPTPKPALVQRPQPPIILESPGQLFPAAIPDPLALSARKLSPVPAPTPPAVSGAYLAAPKPAAPPRKMIRIEGLDEGIREVVYQDK